MKLALQTKHFHLKINFTFLCLAICLSSSNGQILNTINITSPDHLVGQYAYAPSLFGDQSSDPITGEIRITNDGVEPITTGCESGDFMVGNNIALIDRGLCEFGTKVLNAELSGASEVLICNEENYVFNMVPGTDGDQVNIASGMITMDPCQLIKVAILDGFKVEATIQNYCPQPKYGPEVFWGKISGQGDFAGGLGDWRVLQADDITVDTWYHSSNALIEGFYFSYTSKTPTWCNGLAVMNSDLLDNNNTEILGSGPCPAPCLAELESPIIDLSDINPTNQVKLQFSQSIRDFDSDYQLLLSKDGGDTYSQTIELNTDIVQNGISVDQTIIVELNELEPSDLLRLKFRYLGNYYFWAIDDVILLNEGHTNTDEQTFIKSMEVYPNPANDYFNIQLDLANMTDISLELIDSYGSKIFSRSYSSIKNQLIKINTAQLTKGVYLISLKSKKGTKSQKLIIN